MVLAVVCADAETAGLAFTVQSAVRFLSGGPLWNKLVLRSFLVELDAVFDNETRSRLNQGIEWWLVAVKFYGCIAFAPRDKRFRSNRLSLTLSSVNMYSWHLTNDERVSCTLRRLAVRVWYSMCYAMVAPPFSGAGDRKG